MNIFHHSGEGFPQTIRLWVQCRRIKYPQISITCLCLSVPKMGKRENFLSKKIPMNIFHHISGEGSPQTIRLWVRRRGWLRQPLPEGRDSGRIWSGPGKAKKMAIINMNKKGDGQKKGFQSVLLLNTRNYGPSGLRCSLRLQGDIIAIMYRS